MAKKAAKARTPRVPPIPDREIASQVLNGLWEEVLQDESLSSAPQIEALINSALVTVRYCLPTQLLGKLVNPALDASCLQAQGRAEGQWDPRSFAKAVISPWVLQNQKVLGSSADPYVGNPLRRPRLDEGLEQMSDIDQWEGLCAVLADVEQRNDSSFTKSVFIQTLAAVRNRMRDHDFVYVVPPRVSLEQAEKLVTSFLSEKSGGDRGLSSLI